MVTADCSIAGNSLEILGVSKRYPGTQALSDVTVTIGPGEVVALLGENGAGKSTLARIIAGVTPPTAGELIWRGAPYLPTSPRDALAAGIALIHQEMRLLPQLSAAENVSIGRWPIQRGFIDHRALVEHPARVLRRLGFKGQPTAPVHTLSVAAQQQVEIAKALMLNSRLLILDEPTAALGAEETEALFDQVGALRDEGHSFLYISHRLEEIRRLADRIIVMRDGAVVAEHAEGGIDIDTLVAQMVGRSVERLFPEMPAPRERIRLSVRALTGASGRFRDVSFDVREGEVLGVAGIVGAGRTELMRAISGADPTTAGTVEVDGAAVRSGSVSAAIAQGIVMVPEDRRNQGILTDSTISENLMLVDFPAVMQHGLIDRSKVIGQADRAIRKMRVKGRPTTLVGHLSGGNQQKVVIGKWLQRRPRVVVLDEPTRGIDVGARASIYQVICDLADEGMAVIVVSSDLDEVLGLAHRVLVLAQGRCQGVLSRTEATPEQVMALATS